MLNLEKYIRDIPDFPKKGIIFKDITPLLGQADALRQSVEELARPYADLGVDSVAAIESRGFIFGSLVAQYLGVGFIPIRKPGKLPYKTVRISYELEYGKDTIEMHSDAVAPGQKVLMVDDLIATGGTMAAACELVGTAGGTIVGTAFVVELCFLRGRDRLSKYGVHSLIKVN